jgi:hypothetical protein
MKPDFEELAAFVRKWVDRNEANTDLKIEVSLDVKCFEQLDLEVDRV